MKTAWERLARKRYTEYLSRMRRAWKRESCVPIEIWNKWCETWSSPEAVAKSDQSHVNRRGGSVSSRTSAKRQENITCLRGEFGLNEIDGDELYSEAVGGKDHRRRIYGIGSLTAQVSSNLVGGNPSSQTQSDSVDASLQIQLDELKEEIARERDEIKQLSIRLEEALNSAIIPTHSTSIDQE